MPELNELDMRGGPPVLYGRAEPDDEYPRPEEPPDPKLIDKHKYVEFEYDYEEEEDEDDESNYSS